MAERKEWKSKFPYTESKWSSVYGRMGLVFLSASAVAVLIYMTDAGRTPETNAQGQNVLQRNAPGGGELEEQLQVQIGEHEEALEVTLAERVYTEEEMEEVFARAAEQLEVLILGENESLEEVRSDLELLSEIPDTGISVYWEADRYDQINALGELQTKNLTEEGQLVELTALLQYGEQEVVHTFYAKIFAPQLGSLERKLQKLQAEIQTREEESREDETFVLPDTIEGEQVFWRYPEDGRAGGILLMGVVAAGLIYGAEAEKKKKQEKKREEQMLRDYPQIINRFTLYVGAGMPLKKAWIQIAGEYERQREQLGVHYAYEEMIYTMHELTGGTGEAQCYESFGNRCGVQRYRKFASLLSQNLRKGTKGLTALLRTESGEAMEERKRMARKLGEEAGTKLMLPMLLMLVIVMIMVVVPAFLTIQL